MSERRFAGRTGGDVSAAIADLENKVQALAVAISTLVEDHRSRRPPTVWAYDARFPIDAENVYEAEYWDVNIKRWIGPKPELEIRPSLRAGRSYRLTVDVVDFISAEAEAGFAILVNGGKVAFDRAGRGTYRTAFTVTNDGPQQITLVGGAARSPADLSGSEDRRLLSFSISHIFIVESA